MALVLFWGGLVVLMSGSFLGGADAVPLCNFRRVTGIPCPGCGGTRGVRAIVDGRPEHAFDLNPLLFIGLTLAGALFLRRLATGTRVAITLTARDRRAAWIVGGALLLAGWAYVIWRQG